MRLGQTRLSKQRHLPKVPESTDRQTDRQSSVSDSCSFKCFL